MSVTKRLLTIMVLAAVAGMLLGGCRESPAPTPALESPLGTPAQDQTFVSPQSTPVAAPKLVLPTPSSVDVGTIGGMLIRDLAGGGSEPIANAQVLLAGVIRSQDGTPMMAAAGEETSPMAITDENGRFVFTDVLSDTYSLVIATPLGSYLIQGKKGKDFFIDVQAGAVIDAGEIHTTLPY